MLRACHCFRSGVGVFKGLAFLALFCLGISSVGADDDSIFLPPGPNPYGIPEGGVAGPITVTGFKKVPAHEALNAVSFDMQIAGLESRANLNGASEFKNLYLAFAIDVRYLRDCSASRVSSLCTFYHSSLQLSGNVSWTDLASTNRYEVVLVPLEFVMGVFGKQGPDLKTTGGGMWVSAGARVEYLRDLGLAVENRMLSALTASANYSSPSNPISETMGFRWIGSVRVFAGCSQLADERIGGCNSFAGGLETLVGLALDLSDGALSLTNTSRLEGDVGVGSSNNFLFGMNTNRVELKYSKSVCRSEDKGGCKAPRKFNYGGGLRYEYASASFEQMRGTPGQSNSAHRIMLFGELARF